MARRGHTAIAERQGERPQASVAELEARIAALTAELRAKDERYGLVTQAVAEGIYEWEIDSNALWVSARLIEIFGFHGRDLTAGDWNELVHPEDFARYRAALRDCFRGVTARLDCEYRVRHGDGAYRWIEDRAVPVRNAAGRAVRLTGALTDISERKATDQALRERTSELEESLDYQTATSDMLRAISRSTFDLEPLLATVAETAARLCAGDMALIYRRDGDAYELAASFGFSAEDNEFIGFIEHHPIQPSRGTLVGQTALEGGVAHIGDLGALPRPAWHQRGISSAEFAWIEALQRRRVRTMLGVPLLREGVPIGVIAVARGMVRPFTQKQIALVTTFADQAVIAIENARLMNETREALAQQTATAEVLQVINASPGNLAPVFDAMLEKAMHLCEGAFGGLWTFDGDRYVAAALRGVPAAYAEFLGETTAMPGPGSAPDRFRRGERSVIQNIDLMAEELYRAGDPQRRALVDLGSARTAMQVPLCRDDAVLGVITIYRQEVRPFSDKQIALLQNFAAQAVIAMENARLITETREALEQQTATAEVLQVINSSPGDLAPVFDAMLEKAHSLCGATRGALFLWDGATFRAAAAHGYPEDLAERLRQGISGPIFAPLLDGAHLIHYPDLTQVDDPLARAVAERGGVRTNLLIPLRKDSALLGMISCNRHACRSATTSSRSSTAGRLRSTALSAPSPNSRYACRAPARRCHNPQRR